MKALLEEVEDAGFGCSGPAKSSEWREASDQPQPFQWQS